LEYWNAGILEEWVLEYSNTGYLAEFGLPTEFKMDYILFWKSLFNRSTIPLFHGRSKPPGLKKTWFHSAIEFRQLDLN
jgi:hypothetical protein